MTGHRADGPVSGAVRSALAVIAGYAALVLLTTLVQEGLFGGVSYRQSPTWALIAAGILTPLAAVGSGCVTALVAGARPLLHTLPIAVGIAIESTFLYRTGRVDGPLWFEALAAVALIVGVAAGALLTDVLRRGKVRADDGTAGR